MKTVGQKKPLPSVSANRIKGYFVKRVKNFKNRTLSIWTNLVQFIKNVPNWVKARPAAIKKWIKEDRKKKKYRSFRLQKRIKPEVGYVPTSFNLLRQAFKMYRSNFWIFACIMLVHAVLYYLFIRAGSNIDITQVQESIKTVLGKSSGAENTFALLGTVIGANQQREGSAIYSFIVFLTMSLANIWIIRRIYSKTSFKIRDGFYQGMAPIFPVIVILVVMAIQALPFSIAGYAYVIGRTNNLFISGIEDLSFFVLAVFCALLSLYWMTTSVIALYAVTLPNMYPLHTLRLTRKITKFRRFTVFRRVIAFPIIVGLLYAGLLLLCIRVSPQAAPYLAEALPILLLPLLHAYYFNLYRSLV